MADDAKKDPPRWREDFPITWDEDHYVTRRELAKFLTLGSGLMVLANGALGAAARFIRPAGPMEPKKIDDALALGVGQSLLFRYPTEGDPCILIRLNGDRFVAYSQVCTHLSCAVTHRDGADELHCPCHEGFFACADGRPTGGPPERRLPRIRVERREDGLWATGVLI